MKTKIIYIIIFTFILYSAYADGFIVIPEPVNTINTPFPLEVKYHNVTVEINDQIAFTDIDQEFYNPTGSKLEGYYIFPIPKNAVIEKFSMYINGKETNAEVLDAQKAKSIYEEIVRKQLDPALLEYVGQSAIKLRIFPIEPYSVKRVKISYKEVLNKDNGTYEYLYPLNTERFSSKPLNDVSINIHIKAKDEIKNVFSTTHNLDLVRKDKNNVTVSYEEENVKPDNDFVLYYNTTDSKIGISLLTYKNEGEDGYFLLNASPGFIDENNEFIEKDIAFVLDVSGSMDGKKLEKAKKSLLFCINNLNKNDRFEVIRFSTEAEELFGDLAKVDDTNRDKAKDYINNLQAIGGTNIIDALQLVLSKKSDPKRPYIIIFITDGKSTIGETDENRIINAINKHNLNNTRIFTFGIGYDLNIHLLDKITDATKAFRTYITPDEDIEVKISNFYKKFKSPVLTNIKISFDNIKILKNYPINIPDLFNGSSLTLLGRYKGSNENTEVIIEGELMGKKVNYKYNLVFPRKNPDNEYICGIWAARRIGYLLDQIRLNGEDKELINEITDLARKYGIITPYTSYLILEDEITRYRSNELKESDKTLSKISPDADELLRKNKEEYESMGKKSGRDSIQASTDIQDLNNVYNQKQLDQKNGFNYVDNEGKSRNAVNQVKNINGKALYNTGEYWVDAEIQYKNINKIKKIKFASKEYFELIKNQPETAQYLSLGKNIRFIQDSIIIEIHE